MVLNFSGAVPLFTILTPQLEMHPLVPGFAVPGAPVSAGDSVQKSAVIPQYPQISQHAFKGQGGIQASEPSSRGWSLCTWHLWTTTDSWDRRRHGRFSGAYADELTDLQVPAAQPAPCVPVEIFDVLWLDVILAG